MVNPAETVGQGGQKSESVPARADHERSAYDSAFVEAYHAYYPRVLGYVYNRVRNGDLAKDLTADIFARAYAKGDSVRDPAAYTGWLFAIARSVIAGHFRSNSREMKGLDRVKGSLWLSKPADNPEDRAVLGSQIDQLMRYFRMLSARDQEFLSLRFDAELTNAEIGQIMGMSEGNVRVRTFRALQKLRDLIKAEEAAQQPASAPEPSLPGRHRSPAANRMAERGVL